MFQGNSLILISGFDRKRAGGLEEKTIVMVIMH